MRKKDFEIRTSIIRESFKDTRSIKCHVPTEKLGLDEGVHQEGDFFLTENGEFIDLEFQITDFDIEELVKYVELAENIHEKHQKVISIYIICPKEINVHVNEFDIKSQADFTIKLKQVENNLCETVLNGIKHKIENNEPINQDDIDALSMLKEICRKEEKHYYMVETFKILNSLNS